MINLMRRKLGIPYWSLSAWAKSKVKGAVNFIGDFEATLTAEAARHAVDGVVCGHIHHPIIRNMGDLLYVNTGDWVESCSAVIEDYEGRFELIRWTRSERDGSLAAEFVVHAAAE
jgi:UDP-2,3-diacylglucosamine pyrophosphatase LpxH